MRTIIPIVVMLVLVGIAYALVHHQYRAGHAKGGEKSPSVPDLSKNTAPYRWGFFDAARGFETAL